MLLILFSKQFRDGLRIIHAHDGNRFFHLNTNSKFTDHFKCLNSCCRRSREKKKRQFGGGAELIAFYIIFFLCIQHIPVFHYYDTKQPKDVYKCSS